MQKTAIACRPWRVAAAVSLCLLAGTPLPADTFVLFGGDRITGRAVQKGKKTFTVQTAYGRLLIPRAKIQKVVKDDGSEEVVSSGSNPSPPHTPRNRLIFVVLGKTFWQAWDPKGSAAVDPSLRLEIRLDEEIVATYLDAKPDPEDIPGALVNAFSFTPTEVVAEAGAGAEVLSPEVRPGRIVLKVDLPLGPAGPRKLRWAYQVNDGSSAEPVWRDLIQATATTELRTEGPTFFQVRQDRGRMEFSGFPRKRMKNVETFHLELSPQE